MSSRAVKELIKALQKSFSKPDSSAVLQPENRQTLQAFLAEYQGKFDIEETRRANAELRQLFQRHFQGPRKSLGAFVGVLRELQPLITGDDDILDWWRLVVKPTLQRGDLSDAVVDDAHAFIVLCTERNSTTAIDRQNGDKSVRFPDCLLDDLLDIYLTSSASSQESASPSSVRTVETIERNILAFGKQQPRTLFEKIDTLLVAPESRLRALALLVSFLRVQNLHVYLVTQTQLVEHLLTSLLNDADTTILSSALTALLMLMPHVVSQLAQHLSTLFVVYSRLLCWESYDLSCTSPQRKAVLDDRMRDENEDDNDRGTADLDLDDSKRLTQDAADVVMHASGGPVKPLPMYFTFLYGMYPLKFSAYICRPRKYLKSANYSDLQAFDLNQNVIRDRSDRFRALHVAHPSFFNQTTDDETPGAAWAKYEPADLVAMCHGLHISQPSTTHDMLVTQQPPSSFDTLKATDQVTSHTDPNGIVLESTSDQRAAGVLRATAQKTSLSANSSRDFRNRLLSLTAGSRLSNGSVRDDRDPDSDKVTHLQQQLCALRVELDFEKWHKAQYSEHIGQLMRRNIKDATAEAETRNLISINRSLKQQLDQIKSAREATIKDSVLTRKLASNMEANLTEKINRLKREQETWQAEAIELSSLRGETKHYRELLVVSEAKELNKSHHLEIAQRELEKMSLLQRQLYDAQSRLRGYEFHDFEFQRTLQNCQILENENEALRLSIINLEDESERLAKSYQSRLGKIRAHLLEVSNMAPRVSSTTVEGQVPLQRALIDAQSELSQLRRDHARLLERYAALESERLISSRAKHSTSADLSSSTWLNREPFFASTDTSQHANSVGHDEPDVELVKDTVTVESAYLLSSSEPSNHFISIRELSQPRRASIDESQIDHLRPAHVKWQSKRQYAHFGADKAGSIGTRSPSHASLLSLNEIKSSLRANHQVLATAFSDKATQANQDSGPTSPISIRGASTLFKQKKRIRPEAKSSNSGAFRGLRNFL